MSYDAILITPQSTIDLAFSKYHLECAKLLIEHNAKVNSGFDLRHILQKQNTEAFDFLLDTYRDDTYEYILKHKKDILHSVV